MADDYGVAATSLGGHGGSGGPGSGLRMGGNAYDERLQEMRRNVRQQQERQKRCELRQKKKEIEMAQKWEEFQAVERKVRDQEVRERLLREQRSRARQPSSRKATDGDMRASARHADVGSGSLAGVAAGAMPAGSPHGSKTEVAFAAQRESLLAQRSTAFQVAGEAVAATAPSSASDATSTAKKTGADASLQRLRKKKREDGAMAAPLRPGGGQGEKSIMQQAQEQFQGLKKSVDGRAILELSTKQQRIHREALVRLDPMAVERAEQEAEENGRGEEEQQAEDQEQPTISNENGQMARRYRLRTMRKITTQVLQCRRKMGSHLQSSIFVPSGLGCSSQEQVQPGPFYEDEDDDDEPVISFGFGNYRGSFLG